ncbi:cupin domain-containing protein [Achromobacter sp. Marseille-Q0513]|uniref:cupin domain-containing protein n=1 Tax=Achromobacter sp. Marseille-Q0513 TaxID=2829161 RepID=UPI001B9F98F6|nr:cupin domain-containing protein [Achromobacter sp. Marseille-Q0513]MBR8655357.1 cupin domain-containing protein [Achromobacter sp. Marseille-Q0513]
MNPDPVFPPPVFDWLDHFMALDSQGGMRDIGKHRRLQPEDGWLVGIKAVRDDADVHGHIWERHPAGDEMLCVLEGRIVLTLMGEDGAEADVLLDARRSAVVPRGVWHRLHVACPGKILFVTPGQGSEHRRVEGGA